MHAMTTFAGARAARCSVPIRHRPRPLRFIWHHVLPQVCGGKTTADNLTELCDNCHYAVHKLMWMILHGQPLPPRVDRAQLALARRGYELAEAAGTALLIPKESAA